jgi:DNA-binding transcriptional regulator YiaG
LRSKHGEKGRHSDSSANLGKDQTLPSKQATSSGEMLLNLRIEQGLTQEELAVRTGISRSHISNLENNRTRASNGALGRLARALKIEPATLMKLLLAGSGERGGRGGRGGGGGKWAN